MSLLRVCRVADLPAGAATEVISAGHPYAVVNVAGEIICLDGLCPHAGGPLGQGAVHGETLVCPYHGWEFNAKTGVNYDHEDVVLDRFRVLIEQGEIFIDLPEPSPRS